MDENTLKAMLRVDILEINLGYGLIKLASVDMGGDLIERFHSMREKIASDYGFIIPAIRIKDNLYLEGDTYQIIIRGVKVGEGSIQVDKLMAINNGMVSEEINGTPTKEPAFGIDALWIDEKFKEEAIIRGYTVVEPSTVIITHFIELIKTHSQDILTRESVDKLLSIFEEEYPVTAKEVRRAADTGLIQQVLKALLSEKIPIKDMLTILEAIADIVPLVGNRVDTIVETTRERLKKAITQEFTGDDGIFKFATLEDKTTNFLINKLKEGTQKYLLLNVKEATAMLEVLNTELTRVKDKGVSSFVLVVDAALRRPLLAFLTHQGYKIIVLSYAEIDSSVKYEILSSLEIKF